MISDVDDEQRKRLEFFFAQKKQLGELKVRRKTLGKIQSMFSVGGRF